MDERTDRLRAHRRNIDRLQELLAAQITEVERRFIEKRLSEERSLLTTFDFVENE